jgi:hypothetical protein
VRYFIRNKCCLFQIHYGVDDIFCRAQAAHRLQASEIFVRHRVRSAFRQSGAASDAIGTDETTAPVPIVFAHATLGARCGPFSKLCSSLTREDFRAHRLTDDGVARARQASRIHRASGAPSQCKDQVPTAKRGRSEHSTVSTQVQFVSIHFYLYLFASDFHLSQSELLGATPSLFRISLITPLSSGVLLRLH